MNHCSFISSQVRAMQEQERAEAYRCIDYLSYRTEMTEDHRRALCNWGFQVIAVFAGISRVTVVRAISYFDRYMGASDLGSREHELETIQLAFVASLLIALKMDSAIKVELEFFAHVVTRDAYREEDIRMMEMKVLQTLDWRLGGPDPHDFIDRFLQVIPELEAEHHAFINRFSKAIVEVSTPTYSIALQHPSVIAFSAICCGLEYLESIYEMDSLEIRGSLQSISGMNCNDPSQKSVIDSMVHVVRDIFSHDDPPSLDGQDETDSTSVSSEDSPTLIFHPL